MVRKVFFSFHFDNDYWRVQTIRNIKSIEGNQPVQANKWEEIKKKGDESIERWIDGHLKGTSCTIVLIGEETSKRKWVKKEIIKSWFNGNGILGIYIHNLKNQDGKKSQKGENPFDSIFVPIEDKKVKLSSIISCYNPKSTDSKKVYNIIEKYIGTWIEKAIEKRDE